MSEPMRAVWVASSPWAGVAQPGRHGKETTTAGVRIGLVAQAALATIIVRHGSETDLRQRIQDLYSCALPSSGRATIGPDNAFVWAAPDQWLAMSMRDDAYDDLPERLAGLAAVTQQGGSRGLLEIGGPMAREALQKGFAIDLHPSVFGTGSAAAAKVAHIAVQIWQIADDPRYMIAVPRSYLGSFWSWLASACAEAGYEVAHITPDAG